MSKKVLNQLRARETLLNFRAKSFDCDVYKYIEECTTQKLHLLFILVWLRFFSWQNAPVGVCIFVSISVSEQMNLRRKRKCLECQDHLRFHPPLIIFLCVKVGVGIYLKGKICFSWSQKQPVTVSFSHFSEKKIDVCDHVTIFLHSVERNCRRLNLWRRIWVRLFVGLFVF